MYTLSLFDFLNNSQGKNIKKLTYISLFSSAGIGCYGFKQQGFKCIATKIKLLYY